MLNSVKITMIPPWTFMRTVAALVALAISNIAAFSGPTNDNFANAQDLVGSYISANLVTISDATAEPGEPAHLGGQPFKSLWWKWTSPVHGTANFSASGSLATNVVLGVYQGQSVEALTRIAIAAGNVGFPVTGGEDYFIAAAVPTNAIGDVGVSGGTGSVSYDSRPVPGNLLQEPSWEGTAILGTKYWGMLGSIGGAVNERGGADGFTWPTLGTSAQIWQDIPTVPGRQYAIRFAMRANPTYVGDGAWDGQVQMLWDNQPVGAGILPAGNIWFWNWAHITATASNATSRVAFVNLARNIEVDAFSVVDLADPPQIITQPSSASVPSGGTADFVVGASGTRPLAYEWFLNGAAYAISNTPVLLLSSVTTNQAGTYQVVVTNAFGAATSAPVTLLVNASAAPVILWEPYGDTVGVGGYFSFSVVAAGMAPLSYQWMKQNLDIPGATNHTLVFGSVDYTNAGTYSVRVSNPAGIVWSLDATLTVTNSVGGGGKVYFSNRFLSNGTNANAPVFDLDGVTPLNGSNYLAQLYGGLSLDLLRPAGQPSPFISGSLAGFFFPEVVTLPTVGPGSNAVLQVRAWDSSAGASYEEARAFGGRFGKSELFMQPVGGGAPPMLPLPPSNLTGLQSFNLQAGLPEFAVGRISFVERQPQGIVVWAHAGQPGFRYLIEKSIHGFEWRPFVIVTNTTSQVTFTDSADSGSSSVFYRSRILD